MPGMRYQPQGLARLSQPLQAFGLANATLFQAADIEVASPSGLVRNGAGHAVKATRAGLGVSQEGGMNTWRTASQARVIGSGNQFAVMLAFQLNALGQTQKYLAIDGASGGQAAIIYGYVANTVEFFSSGHTGTDPRTSSQIIINDLLPHTVIYTYDGVTFRGFLDGVEKFAVTKTFSINPTSTGHLGGSTVGLNVSNITLLAHAKFSRGLPRESARSLSANPWQLFADPEEDDEFFLQAATGQSITVTPASLLLGGGEVAMRVSRRVAVQPAAIATSGGDVALRAARKVAASAASLAIEPGHVQLRASRRLTVALATMTVTGGSISFAYTPAPATGSYAMAITPAALSLTGGNVSMRVTRRLRVEATSFTLAGQVLAFTDSVTGISIDASAVPAARTVVFSGGKRAVIFNGGIRVVEFDGGIRTVRF